MIYFDNSATSFPKPQSVKDALLAGLTTFGSNPGRSGHSFSVKSALKVAEIRQALSDFVNAEGPEKVIFTSGCTEALNLAIRGSAAAGGHIICTSNDHNSILRPIFNIHKEMGIDYSVAVPREEHKLTLEDILPHVKENTYLICLSHISNVDGAKADILEIGRYCAQKGIMFLVDSAQSLGHKKIDMLKCHIDFLAVAGHKGLYGPMGVGALVVSSKARLKPIKFGGTGTFSEELAQPLDIPEGFESGTLPLPAILGMGAGIEFVKNNFEKICAKLDDFSTYINYELSLIPSVKVYTHPDNASGVIAFNIGNLDSTTVSEILDTKYGIMTRSGLHCAPLKHKSLGTLKTGVVRASISFFTSYNDVQKFLKAVKIIARGQEVKD